MKLSIVIPCYNEVDNIDKLRLELAPVIVNLVGMALPGGYEITNVEVIFVDDGSSDETLASLQRTFSGQKDNTISYSFVRHELNRGLGAALRTGFKESAGDVIVTTDSDGTYKFSTIPNLLECLTPGVGVVTASPYHPDGKVVGVPAYRIFLSRGSSLIYRAIVNSKVYTYTALFRAYRREVVEHISFTSNDYLGATELMVKAILKGYLVAEYPAALHRRVFGVSKARLMQTINSHLRFQFSLLLHKLQISSLK